MQLYRASILNPISDTKCDLYLDGALLVDNSKVIACDNYGEILQKYGKDGVGQTIDLQDKLIIPCFSDIHFHWVQDDVCLMPKANLMAWLEMYTWPTEAKFEDPRFSRIKADFFFKRLLSVGTTSGVIYSSIHEHSVDHAFDDVQGDFIVGSVMMTKNSPYYLTESIEESIAKTKALARKYGERYAVTPRFVPSCTNETLLEAAKIARENNCWIQTHLAETKDPEESSWEILDQAGLLTKKTILGHCIHLDDQGYSLLAERGSVIAHCPSSNAPIEQLGLGSGLFDFHKVESLGVEWSLASDIGAGPYLSMFDVMRSFYKQNQAAGVEVTAIKALYRATLKGCEILGLNQGNFSEGKLINFMVIDKKKTSYSFENIANNSEELLKSILNLPREEFDFLVEKTITN